MSRPYDFAEAVAATRRASESQKQAEEDRRVASADLADKERMYRVSLARMILETHAQGTAWTVAQDIARGDVNVANLRYERDVAKGVLDASEQRAYRHMADRRDMTQFVEWSKRREIAEGYGGLDEPRVLEGPIGGRR